MPSSPERRCSRSVRNHGSLTPSPRSLRGEGGVRGFLLSYTRPLTRPSLRSDLPSPRKRGEGATGIAHGTSADQNANHLAREVALVKITAARSQATRAMPAFYARYCAVMPPSNVSMLPVANRLSSLARNKMPAAISSGVPMRPSNWRAASAARVLTGSALSLRISLK